ncbi:hypothetical protein N864_22220 [Intrasporangium chromatireducens Q5-1]|uniref:Uncharacterized protein n=1 Tax=Intrasporangium chromatireducens Q5-1 TaxID=584657 RepID=W9GSL6_9MICO|nr:PaaI family thioesterase [Intrasporangium chromatireducens]EWT07828.1 hypothetical protein N864_22220 [Intrasporangium chromatireducens Q5-1]
MATTRLTTGAGSNVVARQPLPVVVSEPERLFRVEPVCERDTIVSTTMPTGAWLERAAGRISLGALGVLADDVLGYAVLTERPADHWSVSSEISLDLCHPIETGPRLSGRARPVFADQRAAVTSGEIVDNQGRLVAVGRQQGRFVATMPGAPDEGPPGASTHGPPDPGDVGSVFDLLDVEAKPTSEGALLDVAATPALVNPLSNLHGGITLCLADLVAITAMEAEARALETTSIHVAYLRPVPLGTTVSFVAHVIHSGRTFAVARVEARTAEGKRCISGTVTASSIGVGQH